MCHVSHSSSLSHVLVTLNTYRDFCLRGFYDILICRQLGLDRYIGWPIYRLADISADIFGRYRYIGIGKLDIGIGHIGIGIG